MPNHCANQLTITGPADDLKRFALHACSDESKLDLQQFVPMPEELKGQASRYPDDRSEEERKRLTELYGHDNWYDWHMQNWGTQWNCYHIEHTDDGGELVYTFLTAWCPFSESVLTKMAERFPTLTFDLLFAEIGCAFYGSMHASDGNLDACSQGSLDDCSFFDYETEEYTWPSHLSEDVIRLLESSG